MVRNPLSKIMEEVVVVALKILMRLPLRRKIGRKRIKERL